MTTSTIIALLTGLTSDHYSVTARAEGARVRVATRVRSVDSAEVLGDAEIASDEIGEVMRGAGYVFADAWRTSHGAFVETWAQS